MESYSLSERPALARRPGPYKEMLFSLSQWGWDGALGPQDRAALVVVGRGCQPPLRWEPGLSMGHFCGLSIPSQPPRVRGPPPPPRLHSPAPWADWRKGKKQNKTKTWPDPRPHCCLMLNYPERRLKSNSLFPEGILSKGITLCPLSLPCTLVCLLLLVITERAGLGPVLCRKAGSETPQRQTPAGRQGLLGQLSEEKGDSLHPCYLGLGGQRA